MREYIEYALRGREGLRTYVKWFGLGIIALFIIHMILIPAFPHVGPPFVETSPASAEHYRVLNYYENVGALFAGIAFAYVLAKIIPVAVNGGTSRVNIILGTGVIALAFSAVTILMMKAACLITNGIYGIFGYTLDSQALFNISDAVREKAASDPRVFFFDICISFYLILMVYSAAVIFAAVKQCVNTPAAFVASIASGVLIYVFYLTNGRTYGYPSPNILCENTSIHEIEFALYPDPRMGYPPSYSDCVTDILSDCLIAFLITFLIYALLMLRSSLTKGKKADI